MVGRRRAFLYRVPFHRSKAPAQRPINSGMRATGRRRRDASWNPAGKGSDTTATFAVLVAVPLLLPLAVRLSFLLFLLPLGLLSVGAARAVALRGRREPSWGWVALGASGAVAAVASALATLAAVEPSLELPALY